MWSGVFFFVWCVTSLYGQPFAYDLAMRAGSKGDWQKAQSLLNSVLVEQPKNGAVLYDAGVTAYKLGQFDNARAYFDGAIEHNNNDAVLKQQARFNLGNTHLALKKPDLALKQYETVLADCSDHVPAKHNAEIARKMLQEQQQKQQQQNGEGQQDKNNQKSDDQKNQDQNNQSDKSSGEQKEQERKQSSQDQQNQKQSSENKDQKKPGQNEKNDSAKNSDAGSNDPEQEQRAGQQDKQPDNQKMNQQQEGQQPQERKENKKQGPAEGDKNGKKNGSLQSSAPSSAQQQGQKTDEHEAWVVNLLDEQEKREAQGHKQIIKAAVGGQMAGQDGQNCW